MMEFYTDIEKNKKNLYLLISHDHQDILLNGKKKCASLGTLKPFV